jgi:predicted flap endonuclease-1-like 5' DNA nuclease
MMDMIAANWIAFGLALLLGLLVTWWLFGRASTPAARHHTPDVLDAGAAPAARNQALIDAPPAAQIPTQLATQIDPPAFAGTMAGLGEAIAIGAQDVVAAAEERQAEAALVQPAPTPAATDDLARIKGLGPKLQALLPTLGITTFAQIAALTEADLAELDGKLGAFAGRPVRDGWVEQAGYLAAGDVAGFEARFGKV